MPLAFMTPQEFESSLKTVAAETDAVLDRLLPAVDSDELRNAMRLARARKVARGEAGAGDVLFTASPTAIAAVVYGGVPLGSVQVEGDRQLAERFVKLFPLPAKVDADVA